MGIQIAEQTKPDAETIREQYDAIITLYALMMDANAFINSSKGELYLDNDIIAHFRTVMNRIADRKGRIAAIEAGLPLPLIEMPVPQWLEGDDGR